MRRRISDLTFDALAIMTLHRSRPQCRTGSHDRLSKAISGQTMWYRPLALILFSLSDHRAAIMRFTTMSKDYGSRLALSRDGRGKLLLCYTLTQTSLRLSLLGGIGTGTGSALQRALAFYSAILIYFPPLRMVSSVSEPFWTERWRANNC